jgi:uncharacterized protein
LALRVSMILSPQEASEEALLLSRTAEALGARPEAILALRVLRKSIDARQRVIRVNIEVEAVTNPEELIPPSVSYETVNVQSAPPMIIVGAGPAGLFAALRLIELGCRPIIFDRGSAVEKRRKEIARIYREKIISSESNYGFGEGGAGTFSDGKLFTRSKKRGDINRILDIFCRHGAPEAIRYEAHPHIGTNKLPGVIASIRRTILNAGGEIHFNTRITDIKISSNRIVGVETAGRESVSAESLILATGHSARDIYFLLHEKGIHLEAKPFAMGVRVEHPQRIIDTIQYHNQPRGKYLPPAAYQLAAQSGGRGVYSFCMCPGGFIVPAATGPEEVVVNGMSSAKRNSPFANAGIVVEIRLEDIPGIEADPVMAGLHFQAALEREAFRQGGAGGQKAPGQRLTDFLEQRLSADLPATSYIPGVTSSPLHEWLPRGIVDRIREGFQAFEKKMKGFITQEALLVSVESRTSSPIRIPRVRETLSHPDVAGLFPCGEGAGYAGGIVSSAIDGERCAEQAAAFIHQSKGSNTLQ